MSLNLPEIKLASDLPVVTGAITRAVANGDITPSEGSALSRILESHIKALELADIDARLAVLEGK